MPRYCMLGHVAPDHIQKYRDVHEEVWPELLRALQEAGWRNYSLFLHDNGTLVGYAEVDDLAAAQARIAHTDVNRRWQASVAELFTSDGPPDEAWQMLPEVFHLEDQLDTESASQSSDSAPEPSYSPEQENRNPVPDRRSIWVNN